MKFSVCATFSGFDPDGFYPDFTIRDIERESVRHLGPNAVDTTEPGDSEYGYLADEGSTEWAEAYDVTVSGIFDRETFESWRDALYLTARDENTMGTLGGPLTPWGGIVPDIVFSLEERLVIDSIRVTPVPEDRHGNPIPRMERIPEEQRETVAQRTWDRLRSAVLSFYGPHR